MGDTIELIAHPVFLKGAFPGGLGGQNILGPVPEIPLPSVAKRVL